MLLEELLDAVLVPLDSDLVVVAVLVAVDEADEEPEDVPVVEPDAAVPVELPVPVVEAVPEVDVALATVGPQADWKEDWRETSAAVALLS